MGAGECPNSSCGLMTFHRKDDCGDSLNLTQSHRDHREKHKDKTLCSLCLYARIRFFLIILIKISGDNGEGETPCSIPNQAVKPLRGDGTTLLWCGRVARCRIFSIVPTDFAD